MLVLMGMGFKRVYAYVFLRFVSGGWVSCFRVGFFSQGKSKKSGNDQVLNTNSNSS